MGEGGEGVLVNALFTVALAEDDQAVGALGKGKYVVGFTNVGKDGEAGHGTGMEARRSNAGEKAGVPFGAGETVVAELGQVAGDHALDGGEPEVAAPGALPIAGVELVEHRNQGSLGVLLPPGG